MATTDSKQFGSRTKDLSKSDDPFGNWTVLGFDEKRGNVAYWNCRCACGLERSVKGASLTSGKSTQCGSKCPANPARTDETGNEYGKLTVRESAGTTPSGDSLWLCDCECGNTTIVARGDLRKSYGGTKSCGCGRKTAGGEHKSTEHVSWKEMKRRCYNPRYKDAHLYSERGIVVCNHWKDSFVNFLADIGKKPFPEATVDRIDNDGNYSCGHCDECLLNNWPANCRWATAEEQSHNSRKTILITHEGITDSLRGWARRLNRDHSTLRYRLSKGWPINEVLS